MENFVGVDLHKKVSQLATLREPKPASQVRFPNHTVTVEKALTKLPQGSKIPLEATGWRRGFADLAQRTGHEVVMLHPKQTKAIASPRSRPAKVVGSILAKS